MCYPISRYNSKGKLASSSDEEAMTTEPVFNLEVLST